MNEVASQVIGDAVSQLQVLEIHSYFFYRLCLHDIHGNGHLHLY